jgi:hypothetical protein
MTTATSGRYARRESSRTILRKIPKVYPNFTIVRHTPRQASKQSTIIAYDLP